jgi:hypothetical protein
MTDDDDIQEYSRPCPNCEYHRKRAQLWRDEAYKQAGHPLPERELVCVCGAVWEGQELVEAPPKRTWVGLTELEKAEITSLKWLDWEDTFDIEGFIQAIEAKLKEKNT